MKQFEEDLLNAVITTRFVLLEKEPILNVAHHEDDGAWEFTGPTQAVEDSDYKVIALGEVIAFDETILDVADLPLGYKAFRPSPDDPWTRYPIPPETSDTNS
ncbi:hypothetical protein [Chitinophaga rhizophila]|uniref:DUF2185 domain-containing protein n=1 Tax=Chitinophaga rhizophila TaxID=2866212 RepID=A0ABS7GHT5_9BACT|nr:hypothetical protein [Chitinophaga rhizophila]MBW8687264.1 hypothetical protein [Chitinophaga rhizophila]